MSLLGSGATGWLHYIATAGLRYDRGMGTQADSEIVVPASPEETWQAVTDPERLAEWLGEASELDLRPRGDLRIALPDGERSGLVEEVEEPHPLRFWGGVSDRGARPGQNDPFPPPARAPV